MKQLAIIGATASGKTALAIEVATQLNAHILSIDSLSIYKEIDIVSAKPTLEERAGIEHFGIDHLSPNAHFDVTTFIQLYHEVVTACQHAEKNLVIVGGTSFYLKMLLEGISQTPTPSKQTRLATQAYLLDLPQTYAWLHSLDPTYMAHITPHDRYRIEKVLHLYLESGEIPTAYFKQFPPTPTITMPLPLYQITTDRTTLRRRIVTRTEQMLHAGLIDEVCTLEQRYTRTPNAMKAIGIKETLGYLDGLYTKPQLIEKISTNTARLAKRQTTFNTSQFEGVTQGSVTQLQQAILG